MRLRVVVAYERILFCLLWDKLSRSGQRRHRLPISAALRSDRHSPPNHLNGGITNPAVKEDGVTNQRVTIHYNCIGAFEVPDRRKIPERDILLETRKGVALSYAPAQIAI